MNDEAKQLKGFLDAIAKNPRDVDQRKIYADWLDEHDEPEEADRQRSFDLELHDAEQRLRQDADRYADGNYDGMLAGVLAGEYRFSSDSYDSLIESDRFWKDVEKVTKQEVREEFRASGKYRCSC